MRTEPDFVYVLFVILTYMVLPCASTTCPVPDVDPDTIRLVSYTDADDAYTLHANVSWQPPSNDDIGGYFVRLHVEQFEQASFNIISHPLSINKCTVDNSSMLSNGFEFTRDAKYTFNNINFGYQYFINIFTVDTSTLNRNAVSAPFYSTKRTLDCYETTGDLEFCRNQTIPIASAPVNPRITCAVSSTKDDTLAEALIEWNAPVQIASTELKRFEVRLESSDQRGVVEYQYQLSDDEKSTIQSSDALYPFKKLLKADTGHPRNADYTLLIKPWNGLGGNPARVAINMIQVPDCNVIWAEWGECDCEQRNRTRICNDEFGTGLTCNNKLLEAEDCKCDGPTTQASAATTASPVASSGSLSALGSGEVAAIVLAILIAFVILIVVVVFILFRRFASKDEPLLFKRDQNNIQTRKSSSLVYQGEDGKKEIEPLFEELEIDRSKLKIGDELGSGQFGVVYKGFTDGLRKGQDESSPVAVKGLKKTANRSMKEDFLDEIRLVIEIGSHPNILAILGCITVDEPYYLVTEFMEYGDLRHFLWKCKEEKYISLDPIYNLSDVSKLKIGLQIAHGMDYLSKTRFYHGDLAARNVLVGKDMVCKISDFGMAEDIYMRDYKRLAPERKRPVKWVSLETNTTGKCSIESDVWSFGIVLYEIYTLGGIPYPTMDGKTVLDKLLAGYRMEKPTSCPNDVYDVMRKCWQEKPEDRPSFHNLYVTFDKMLGRHSGYLVVLAPKDVPDIPNGNSGDKVTTYDDVPEELVMLPLYEDRIVQSNGKGKAVPNTYTDPD